MNAAIPERHPVAEEIPGVIEGVSCHNEENGFCVLRINHLPTMTRNVPPVDVSFKSGSSPR
jgi:hypothetical protein